jgi:hypothetical protein
VNFSNGSYIGEYWHVVNTRLISAKLFFGLAALASLTGLALFDKRLPVSVYLNPLNLLIWPSLIPFGVAIIFACFGLVYFIVERNFGRKLRLSLSIAHAAFLLLWVYGRVSILRFWFLALGDRPPQGLRMPIGSVELGDLGLLLCLLAFVGNLLTSSRLPTKMA